MRVEGDQGGIGQVDEGPDASGVQAASGGGEPLEAALRLQARLWARRARQVCLALLLAGLAACAGAGMMAMRLH